MSRLQSGKGVVRKFLGKIKEVISLPNLIDVQLKSFNDFVQLDCLPSHRKKIGLEKVLQDVFPIEYDNRISLEYIGYELGHWECACGALAGLEKRYAWNCSSCNHNGHSYLEDKTCTECHKKTASYITCKKCLSRVGVKPQLSEDECRYSGKTFSMPLKVKVQLITWDVDPKTEKRSVRDIKEQDVFFCDLPVMVNLYEKEDGRFYLGSRGTFIINGVDRVIVSQIQRAPGVIFTLSKKSKDYRGNAFHLARIIPSRGAWLDFEFDYNDILYVRIDKKKKILVTTFLQALGIERDAILPMFYNFETVLVRNNEFIKTVDKTLIGQRLEAGSIPANLEKTFVVGKRVTSDDVAALKKKGLTELAVRKASLLNRILGSDVVDPVTGEILADQGQVLTEELLSDLAGYPNLTIEIIQSSGYVFQPTIALTLAHDTAMTFEDAVKEVYYKLKPGDVADHDVMKQHINNIFFNPRFYDLSRLGRIRSNRKLGLAIDEHVGTLTKEDILSTLKGLVALKERGEGELDDIDNLSNRCVHLVGELLQGQVYLGFARIEKVVLERFRLQEYHAALMPYDFLNVKPLSAVLKEFFGTGQLSQFMDQTNPLSEIAHKRRLSALGPGGLTRERATTEVRDVHASHFGRICPIETPEGQNIGLISSLATYARVSDLGFVETPLRTVKNRVVTDEVVHVDAYNEQGLVIAQAATPTDGSGKIVDDTVLVRSDGNIMRLNSQDVTHVYASPKQLVSVPTALIPFLEHDDANRALMGSNMQRQAVPLIRCQAPLVGTGIEREVGVADGLVIIAKHDGTVQYVSADKIVIRRDARDAKAGKEEWFSQPLDIYNLRKYRRSNHNTWVHQDPIVHIGQKVKQGDVLSNGQALNNGELALGTNVLVAFMPWLGYNFEDAIVLSKRLVTDDVFTSVHLEEFVVEARDTKLGPEEITRDLPNVGEKALEGLDEDGIVKIGTRVGPGDIMVGKITLKGDVQYSPEEKLLRAIFGEKSREVRDTSLRVPPGIEGTVVDVKLFSRSGARKDKRYKEIVTQETLKLEKDFSFYVKTLHDGAKERIIALLENVAVPAGSKDLLAYSAKGVFVAEKLKDASVEELFALSLSDKKIQKHITELKEIVQSQIHVLTAQKESKIALLRKGDDLPSGVIKMVRVYVAMKRNVSVGDKMAGRHGNKGVVSNIVDIEDLPYMQDGTPVDIVLNPLGIPGRMNIGQILETVLGMAGRTIGQNVTKMLEDKAYDDVSAHMHKYFGKEVIAQLEKDYGKDAVFGLAREVADRGMSYTTPIFDGPSYKQEIQPLINELGLPSDLGYELYDGRSGEKFHQPVTVGCIYMMKLNHLADDKLHARSVGPYSLITQQPLGGKAQFGGQRLGEMEVWALYAYGAAYTLQEMLTVKSDDVNGRVKVYESIVRGDDITEPGIPESFNVLVKELQSLGLQVSLFKSSKEQVSE
jgi:DNA-directed RNA polymerase subunit beta